MARELTEKHIKAYKSGIFRNLFNVIQADSELSFEIRKNNVAMVYYHKDKILSMRYTSFSNWKVMMLDKKYYQNGPTPSVNMTLEETLNRPDLIRKYFQEAKELVYVYKVNPEFCIQQNIASSNRSFDKRFLVVDMEWQFSQENILKKDRICKTKIDLLIVDTKQNSNGKNDIYLSELKVGVGAVEGKSGIIGHVDKTMELLDKKEARQAILDDVEHIIRGKISLGLMEGNPKDFIFEDEPKMMLIVVSRSKYEKKKLEKYCKEAQKYVLDKYKKEIVCMELDASIDLSMHSFCTPVL